MNHIVCGRMKQGKTTFATWLGFQKHRAVVAWDPRCMIDGIPCYGPDELQEAIDEGEWKHGVPLVYRFDSTDVSGEFSSLCGVLFPPRMGIGNFSLVVDEAAQLQRANWCHPDFDRAIRQHPRSVDIIQATHSLQDYSRASRDLTSDIYSFNLMGKSLDALVNFCEVSDSDDFREAVRTLPQHHLVHWNHSTNEWEVWDDPTAWGPRQQYSSVSEIQPVTERVQ
jgi:hypothetical protein